MTALYCPVALSDQIFIDVTESAGLTFEHTDGRSGLRLFNEFLGSGGGFFDYDGDGDLDIYLVNGAMQTDNGQDKTPHNVLYRNNGDNTFTDVTKAAGVGSTAYGTGATVGDYDNDGDLDLYVTNFGADQLYQNNGDSTFTDITTHAQVGNPNWGTSCAFADVDNDGHLDLYIANYAEYTPENDVRCEERGVHVYCGPHAYPAVHDTLYKNNGDGTFTDVSTLYRPADLIPQHGLGVTFGDYDADGNIDLYVANDQDPNFLFQNSGAGNFLEVALISGVCYNDMGKEEAGMGTDFGDYDNDGKLDLTVSNYQTETNTVYRNHDSSFFTDNTITSGIAEVTHGYLGWGIRFFDYDNDGHQDIFVANGHLMDNINVLEKHVTYPQRNLLFRNLGDGTFANITSETDGLALKKVSRGAAIGDYDNDGDLDILVTNCNQRPDLLQNAVGNQNNWIQVQVVGQKSNRSGIGARIKVVTGTHVQYREVQSGGSYLSFHDLRAHFGVGVTVMAWINAGRHMGPNEQRWQGILSKGNSPRSYSFYTESPSECLHLSAGGGSVCTGKIALNEWQHVAAQVDDGTHRYWLNGENVGEFGGKGALPGAADTSSVFVGKTPENNREFLGLLDEVRIWNRALNEEEIQAEMNSASTPVEPLGKLSTTWATLKFDR